ncbi:MAG: RNA polymerase sigma factor [Ruminococcus sp.]|nr:RNA polymerase sigma factor [Ruminococcus sp.]
MTDNENTALYAFRKYGDTVLRAAYACTGSMQEAEDITQDVFLKLHSSQTEFANDEHMKAWLLRAAINLGRNYRKSFRFSRTSSIDDENAPQIASPVDDPDGIKDMIRALPQKYSEVIFLYYYEGYNIREISEFLGKSENTVSSLLQRGRKKLRMELEKEDNYGSERI